MLALVKAIRKSAQDKYKGDFECVCSKGNDFGYADW